MAVRQSTAPLALPRQKCKHTGLNLSETVSDVIAEYSLHSKVGYFTTDNASSNEACLDLLAKEHGFERDWRWTRCSGHIFNLVARAALFGKDSDAFTKEIDDLSLEGQQLIRWRRKGPIGKLHDVVYWINRSPRRCERFEQLHHVSPSLRCGLTAKKETYELVKDAETRWNSSGDGAERAPYLQTAIDELLLRERESSTMSTSTAVRLQTGQPSDSDLQYVTTLYLLRIGVSLVYTMRSRAQ